MTGDTAVTEDILLSVKDGIAWVTLNHPERHNAFDVETLAELIAVLGKCSADPTIGVIVLTGAGDKAFCAGGFLRDLTKPDTNRLRALFMGTLDAANAIRKARQPVIAAINGFALGGGNELVVACDLAIASENAVLGQTEPRVGSAAVLGGTNALALSIGEKRAKEVSFLCRRYTASQALAMGWVNEVTPHAQLINRTSEWCEELLALSPQYLQLSKVSSNYWWDLLQPGLHHGASMLALAAGSAQMIEGAQAFMERREPDFRKFRC